MKRLTGAGIILYLLAFPGTAYTQEAPAIPYTKFAVKCDIDHTISDLPEAPEELVLRVAKPNSPSRRMPAVYYKNDLYHVTAWHRGDGFWVYSHYDGPPIFSSKKLFLSEKLLNGEDGKMYLAKCLSECDSVTPDYHYAYYRCALK